MIMHVIPTRAKEVGKAQKRGKARKDYTKDPTKDLMKEKIKRDHTKRERNRTKRERNRLIIMHLAKKILDPIISKTRPPKILKKTAETNRIPLVLNHQHQPLSRHPFTKSEKQRTNWINSGNSQVKKTKRYHDPTYRFSWMMK